MTSTNGRNAVGCRRRAPRSGRGGFTLTEMLVVVVIIAILAGMTLGAVSKTQEAARAAKTKTTIAKLDVILQRLYASYRTRRVPVDFTGMNPSSVAALRRDALRDLMRMEMPQCWSDITTAPLVQLPQPLKFPEPAAQFRYQTILGSNPNPNADHQSAKCLYMIIMNAGSDARSQFTADEIDLNHDNDGLPYFVDGWGHPIGFLRWAPGFTPSSDIQKNDPLQYHDPLDPLNTDKNAYQLYPFIYAGVIGKITTSSGSTVDDYGLWTYGPGGPGSQIVTSIDPYTVNGKPSTLGEVISGFPYTNHHMETK